MSNVILGYQTQTQANLDLVNANKQLEERVLRVVDALQGQNEAFDQRWVALARTHIEIGFGAMNRAILQPKRIKLPGDNDDSD